MLLIIYSILIGYMFFFTLCIAPIINNTLDRENASKLLRKVNKFSKFSTIFLNFLLLLLKSTQITLLLLYIPTNM